MTITGFPHIATDPLVAEGLLIVAGTRVRLSNILDMLAGGATSNEIERGLPIEAKEDAPEALAYVAAEASHSVLAPE